MGLIWTLLAAAMLALASYGAARDGFRRPVGWSRSLAAAVLAWAWSTLGLQILGSSGFLGRVPLLAWAAVGLAIAGGIRLAFPFRDSTAKPPASRIDLPASLAIALAIWVATMIGVPSLLLPPKVVSDGPIYHLYFAARWWKAGRVFLIATPFGETAAPYFPANGDLFFSGLMALFGGDRLARVGQVPFLVLSSATVYAMARKLGASASSSAIATAWVATCMPLLLFSMEANVDTIFVAGYLLAAYFGISYAKDDGEVGSLFLAGLAAGAAWGTKPTASAFIPPLLALIGLGVVLRRVDGRTRAVHLLALAGSSLILSGFWFVRGAWIAGNPLYPLHVRVFGRVVFRGWYASEAMTRSQFYIPMGDVEALAATITSVFDPRLVPLWLAGLAGAWGWWGRRKPPLAGWIWLCSALAVANVATYWLLIPYRTQQRFMLQGLAIAAIPLARTLDRGWLVRWAAVALLIIHLLTPQYWPWRQPDDPAHPPRVPVPMALLNVPLTPQAWREVLDRSEVVGFHVAQLGVLIGAAIASATIARVIRPRSARGWGLAGLLVLAMPTGYALFLNDSVGLKGGAVGMIYPNFADYAAGWRKLEAISPPEGARIAYAGTNLPYYLMGGRLRNRVSYVNVDAHPGWLLHDYHLSARDRGDPPLWDTPRPGWDRVHPDYSAWLENLRRDKIQLLVVAQANPQDGGFNAFDSDSFPIERYWAESHRGDFERLYPRERPDPRFWIYRVLPQSATDDAARSH